MGFELRKIRRRYLALKIEGVKTNARTFEKTILNSILRLFGEYGLSKMHLNLIEFDSESNFAILRCRHNTLCMVRAAIAAIKSIDGESASIHVLGISGTLKSARRFKSKLI